MTLTLLSIISAIGVATMQRVYLIRSLSHWHTMMIQTYLHACARVYDRDSVFVNTLYILCDALTFHNATFNFETSFYFLTNKDKLQYK